MATKTREYKRHTVNGVKIQSAADLEASGYFALPPDKRVPLAIGRGGRSVKGRKYGLVLQPEIDALVALKNDGDVLPNPFNNSWASYFIDTMKKLGLNKAHTRAKVFETFKELTSAKETKDDSGKTFWQRWSKKPARNANGRDVDGRFDQNIEVYQRLGGNNPPGRKLLHLGQKVLGTKGIVIEVTISSKKNILIALNTDSDTPINQTKRGYKPAAAVETAETVVEAVATPQVETATEVTPVVETPAVTVNQPAEVAVEAEVVIEPAVTVEPVATEATELAAV